MNAAAGSTWDARAWLDATRRYIGYPLAQMALFILGSAVILTVISYVIAFIVPPTNPNITPVQILSNRLPAVIINGVTIGFVYAMIALGYTMVYGVLKFINFAHSELFMTGSAVGYGVMVVMNESGVLAGWNPIPLVVFLVACAMMVSGLLAVTIERVAYRPLRGAPRLVPLISAIGVSFFLTDFVRAIFAITRNEFNLTYPLNGLEWAKNNLSVTIGATVVNIRPTQIIVVVGAILMLIFLNYFVNGTKLGRGIRAVSQDMTTAGLMGINANRIVSLTFFVGGAFGGAAGVLFGLNVGTITPFVGFFPGLKAFTAAVLGGIGSITGALLGGLALGMIETFLNLVLTFFPVLGGRYTDIFAFAVLILILIFRPSGILGERVDEKV